MKKIYYLCFLFLCLFLTINVKATISVDSSLKIYDYGELLTEEEEISLKEEIDTFVNQYDLDMVVVTLKDYTGSLKTYGQDFYDYNDFGVGKTHDGILLVLNVDNLGPVAEIVTTGEGIRMYDDNRISGLLSAMSSAKYDGNRAIVSAFISRASSYAKSGIPASNRDTYIDSNGEYRIKREYPLILVLIASSTITLIATLILVARNKMVEKASGAKEYLNSKTVNISLKQDNFIYTHTTKTLIPRDSGGSSFGGGGGGSSISHGSSGISHGGGGGRL